MRDIILSEWEKGNVVFATADGLRECRFEDFIKQPLEGMLYDINRDAATVATFLDNPKWVNDYALTKLLRYYYEENKRLKGENV